MEYIKFQSHPLLAAAIRELDRHLPLSATVIWVASGRDGVDPRAPGDRSVIDSLLLADQSRAANDWLNRAGLSCGMHLAVAETPFARCLEEGLPLYADWHTTSQRRDPLAERLAAHGAKGCFAVPLRGGDRTAGVLQSVSRRQGGFTREQIQLLHLVADVLGPAITNCQLFEQTRKAYEDLRATQSQLVQAEKMRALGELAGGMAHDFNNALCGVLGFLELAIADPELPATCKSHLQSARTSALDAAHTVKRVQDFSRGRGHELKAEPLDGNELMRQTLELTRPEWEGLGRDRARAITVRADLQALARTRGNASELRELLTNLVFNAVDAMPEGGVLTLRTRSTAAEVCLCVEDTGTGIPDAVRRRLFEPFFSTKGERGTGLGLSVSFGIARRHGGAIEVESVLGRGSTFTVRLPALKGSIHAPPESPCRQATTIRPLRILVVEDEVLVQKFLDLALTAMGHHPRLTANGDEALAAFESEALDLVLTDMGLPGASGEDVARAVTRRSPRTPVILLTGWDEQLAAEAKRIEGVSRVLTKPVTLPVLEAAIQEVCALPADGC